MLRIAIAALLSTVVLTGAAFAQEVAVDEIPWTISLPAIEWQTWDPRDSTTDFVAEYAGRVELFPLAVLAGHNHYLVEFEFRRRGEVLSHFSQVVTDGKPAFAHAPRFGEPLTGTVSAQAGPVRNWRGLIGITPPNMDVPEQVELSMTAFDERERFPADRQPPAGILAAAQRFMVCGLELLVYCPEADEFTARVTRSFRADYSLTYEPDELVPVLRSSSIGWNEYLGSLTAALR